MNKTIAIWDLHWSNIWEKIISQENTYDNIIFLWDYFDSSKISWDLQLENFENIVNFKKANLAKVEILLWNHELGYLVKWEYIKWFQVDYEEKIKRILEKNIDLFKVVKSIDNILFSHSWFSKTWFKNLAHFNFDFNNIENEVNDLFFWRNWVTSFKKPFTFYDRDDSWIWYAREQWPLWIRPGILCNDMIDNFIQVVWHSYIPIDYRWNYNDLWLYPVDNISIENKDEDNYYLRILHDEFSTKIKEIIIN